MNKNQTLSGTTFIRDNSIIWEWDEKIITKVSIDKIKLVGEVTSDHGPFAYDWFLVFIISQFEHLEISMYANGIEDMMVTLGKILGLDFQSFLASSTDWNSRIMYPESVRGMEIWNFEPVFPISIMEKIKSICLGESLELKLTEAAKKILIVNGSDF